MSTTTKPAIVLEPAARAFADATANPPYLFELGPVEGQKVVDDVQSGEMALLRWRIVCRRARMPG